MQNNNIYILAIESSCDDTSCAILLNTTVLANITASQKIHQLYGGVVPELASRDHQKNCIAVVDATLKKAAINLHQLSAIAVTQGPGLIGSLLVGLSFAKSMALALNIPLITVNHMQAHVLAHFINEENNSTNLYQTENSYYPKFPFVCLTISGGHTQILKVNNFFDFEIIGETLDDAVGEAFDKAAKIIGLEYPGGPLIDKYAQLGDATKFSFADAKINAYNYSFSGIKTSFLYFIQTNLQKDKDFVSKNINDICASYQHHLIKVVLKNVVRYLEDSGIKQLAIAGGVSANSELRKQIKNLETRLNIKTFIPKFEYCTDNAAMIGITGYYKFLNSNFSSLEITPKARMLITE